MIQVLFASFTLDGEQLVHQGNDARRLLIIGTDLDRSRAALNYLTAARHYLWEPEAGDCLRPPGGRSERIVPTATRTGKHIHRASANRWNIQ